jgi:hypothetical protein
MAFAGVSFCACSLEYAVTALSSKPWKELRLRLVALENDTVESIQTVETSQPKIRIGELRECVDYSWHAVFGPPRYMCDLNNGLIAINRGGT